MLYRRVVLRQLGRVRSSVAGDLIAAAPPSPVCNGCEYDAASRIGAVVVRDGPACVRWRDGRPPRGELDLWDAGVQLVIADQEASDRPLGRLFDIDNQIDVGLLCVEAAAPDAVAALRRLLTGPNVASWHVLWLGDADMPPADLAPAVIACAFGFRPSRSVERPAIPAQPDGTAARTSHVRLDAPAVAEGQALWGWLRPRLRLEP